MTDYKRPSVFQQTLENGTAGFAGCAYTKEEEIRFIAPSVYKRLNRTEEKYSLFSCGHGVQISLLDKSYLYI
jgi:hypothetical protein